VLLAVTTRRNSSGIPNFGKRNPPRMGDAFETQEQNEVRLALHHMTDVEKSLLILDIKVERGLGGRARTTISFKDLVTGDQDKVRV
jgi:hypothetical protein